MHDNAVQREREHMKKNNGFSMVEIIIVIAIMAILASVLAPTLIKYINKARISSDIDTGRTIVTAITTNIADTGDFNDDARTHTDPYPVNSMDNDTFKAAVFKTMGVDGDVHGKANKGVDGVALDSNDFYYTLDIEKNFVAVYYGGTTDDYQVYPKLGAKFAQ